MTQQQPNIFTPPATDQDEAIARQAMAWFAKRLSGEMPEQDNHEFSTWLAQNPAHRQAYQEVEMLWQDSDFNQALATASQKQTAIPPQVSLSRRVGYRNNRPWLGLSAAASIVLFILSFDPLTRLQADYITPVGVSQAITLSDGTQVTLNTDSALAVAYTEGERRVRLLKGEAYFDVRHLESQPFIVDSGDTETQDIGTRFIVRATAEANNISVLEGLVKVSRLGGQQNALLHPGEVIHPTEAGLGKITQHGGKNSGWLQGRLSFQDTPLGQVVAELDRYIPGLVVILGNDLKTYRINARFNINQPRQALATLAYTLPVSITQAGPWLTVIRSR